MKSKTIILSSEKKFISNSPRAILTFINEGSSTEGKIRLYNLSKLTDSTKLGIYYNQEIYSANLFYRHDCYTFSLDNQFNLSQNIYCALIDVENKNEVVLSGGSDMSFNFSDSLSNIEENEDIETLSQENDEINEDLNAVYQPCEDINEISNNSNLSANTVNENLCSNCKNCIYKEFFYSHQKQDEVDMNNEEDIGELNNKIEIEENIETAEIKDINNNDITQTQELETNNLEEIQSTNINEDETNVKIEDYKDKTQEETEKFLLSITEQLDEMFKNYPLDNVIMNIIPNSKVIKVEENLNETNYIIGVIYENDEIKYLLYGVPAKYNSTPPQELGEHYQWLALDAEDPLSDGYFLIYQDATDGKIVPIIVE
ncbi:MAG: hypothetical protein IJX26_00695 [Clostridia bacterium]|nr:hypothetical protein [Clostridia bacterium]